MLVRFSGRHPASALSRLDFLAGPAAWFDAERWVDDGLLLWLTRLLRRPVQIPRRHLGAVGP